jgi:hypothetical protein
MASKNDSVAALEAIEHALKCLESALEHTGRLFPTTEASAEMSQEQFGKETLKLPDSLKDPMKVLERGMLLEREGLRLHEIVDRLPAIHDFAIAARNGKKIGDEVLVRMRADRGMVEAKKASK